MPANECIPFRVPGESIPVQATGATGGMRFCKISAPRVGGGQTGGTSRVTTSGPGYGANTLSTDVVDLPQVIQCSATTDAPLGVCGWDLATGNVGKAYTRGHGNILPIITGANIVAGNEVQTDANGAAIPLAAGKAVGLALDSATSPAPCEILLY